MNKALSEYDAIVLPVLKTTPPRMDIAERAPVFEAHVLGIQNTVPVNYAGNPAIAIPVLLQKGNFPVTSVQVIGPNRSEAELLNIGRLIEEGRYR